MFAKYTQSCLNCLLTTYYVTKNKITTFIQLRQKKQDFFSANLFGNDEEQPAIILSNEEIESMISKQSQYVESNTNIKEYIIIKDKDKEANEEGDELIDKQKKIDEIKNEISDFEFEEDDTTDKQKQESIEDLKSSILNDNSDA